MFFLLYKTFQLRISTYFLDLKKKNHSIIAKTWSNQLESKVQKEARMHLLLTGEMWDNKVT